MNKRYTVEFRLQNGRTQIVNFAVDAPVFDRDAIIAQAREQLARFIGKREEAAAEVLKVLP